jgi:hypothetical protein
MSLAPDTRRVMYVSEGPVTHETQSVERHAKRVIGEGLPFFLDASVFSRTFDDT